MDAFISSDKIQQLEEKVAQLSAKLIQQQDDFKRDTDKLKFYYESILSSIPGHVYWMDAHGSFLGCNELQAKHALMTSPDALIGKSLYDIFPYDVAHKLSQVNQHVLETREPLILEEEAAFLYDAGVYLSHKIPLFNQAEEVIGLVGISLNITEQKRIERELMQAKEKAEHLTQAQSMFIANMSHDIRTPLSGILGMAQILRNEVATERGQEYLQWIQDCGQELLKLMNGFLDMMSLEHVSELSVMSEPWSLHTMVRDIVKLQQPLLQTKQLILDTEIDPKIPKILLGDATKIHRILLNLVGNAVKFTHHGGVRLVIRVHEETNSECSLHFSVADTGIGIPGNMLDKIFDRFFRLTPSARCEYEGYGIGLCLVKSYIELLGGTIQVVSQEDQGSTFEFYLKFQKEQVHQASKSLTS